MNNRVANHECRTHRFTCVLCFPHLKRPGLLLIGPFDEFRQVTLQESLVTPQTISFSATYVSICVSDILQLSSTVEEELTISDGEELNHVVGEFDCFVRPETSYGLALDLGIKVGSYVVTAHPLHNRTRSSQYTLYIDTCFGKTDGGHA